MARKFIVLKRGQFYDPNTQLRLKAGKPVPHPPEIGPLTREWIACGGIKVIDPTPPAPPEPEPMEEKAPFEERVQAMMEKYTMAELRAKLRDNDIRFSWNAKEQNLAEKLVEANLE